MMAITTKSSINVKPITRRLRTWIRKVIDQHSFLPGRNIEQERTPNVLAVALWATGARRLVSTRAQSRSG